MINAQSTICEGQQRNYSVDDSESSSGTPNSSYVWTINDPNFQGTLLASGAPDDTNDVDIDWGTTPPGIYELQVTETSAEGCVGETITHIVELIPLPDAPTLTAINSIICSGENAEFNIQGISNATISYSVDGGTTIQTLTTDATGLATVTINDVTADTTLEILDIYNGNCTAFFTSIFETITVSTINTSPISAN